MGDQERQGAVPREARPAGIAGDDPSRVAPETSSPLAGESGVRLTLLQRVIRRLMHLWFWASRGMTLGVRIIALDGEGRVFLVRHSYLPGWHLPGGGVEPGQTLEEAALMELREEGNVVPESVLQMRGMCFNRLASRRDHVAVFLVQKARQSAPHVPNREIVEAEFFALRALPEGTTPATRRRLNEMLEGRAPDAYW